MSGRTGIPQTPVAGLAWVATVTLAEVWRWSSRDITLLVSSSPVAVRWGLEADEQVEQVGAVPSPPTIALPWPGTVQELLDHAEGAVAELAIVAFGDDAVARWEDRLVVASGPVRDIEIDPRTHVVSIQLETLEQSDTADLCPPSYAVSRQTWPLAAEEAWGGRVPFVYGAPGSFEFPTVTDTDEGVVFDYTLPRWWETPIWKVVRETRSTAGTPAIPIDVEIMSIDITLADGSVEHITDVPLWPRYVAVCQGWTSTTAASLWFKDETSGWTLRDVDLSSAYDGRGQPVTLAALPGTFSRKAGEWWIGWTEGPATPGQLGALVVSVLRRAAVDVDWPSVLTAAAWLDRYQLGGYVDDSITPVQWVTDRLRPFGVTPRWTGAGLGLVIDRGPAEPVARLEVGVDAQRAGPLKIGSADCDEVVVTWAANRGADRRQMRTVARRAGATGRRVEELAAPEVWDETTAIAVAREALQAHGPVREMVLTVVSSAWWWLRASDVVHLVDVDVGADGPWRVVAARHSTGPYRQITVREVLDGAVVVASGDNTDAEAGR